MRKKDRLIALISALTQGERKFFAQNNRSKYSTKSYIKLYELLLNKNEYNADELCKALNKSKAYLANDKKYLEKILLTSLRHYHEKNPQVAMLNHLAEAVLLMERNLPDMSAALVKQCITDANLTGLPAFTFHAHGLMLTLSSDPFGSFNETENTVILHLGKMKEAATQIQLTVDFELFNTVVFAAYNKRKKDITDAHRRETQKLLNNKLLKKDYSNFDFMSYKYNLQALLFSRIGNNLANIEVNRKCLQLYEQQTTIDAFGYWNALANLTQSIIASGNRQMYVDWMIKLESRFYHKLPVDASHIDRLLNDKKSIFISGAYYAQLCKNEISPEQVRIFTKKFIKKFDQERKLITASHFVSAVYKTAACCFIIDDVTDCIDLLNRLFNETDEVASPTMYKNAKLLFIIAHIEWNKFQLISSLIPSAINYLKKSGQYGQAEQLILQHFSQLSKLINAKARRLWFTSFKELIHSLSDNAKTETNIELTPFKIWIENKMK